MDLDRTIDRLRRCELIPESDIKDICMKARYLLLGDDNVLCLSSPLTLCGDIHAQFFDLLELFRVGGEVLETCYLFMGDYVDRGNHSIESFIYLLAMKIKYPDRIWLLRGNHESRQITQVYGFYDECLKKYGSTNVWRYCCDVFDCLSVSAIVDGTVFVVHGGLSPSIETIDDIRNKITRIQEIPNEGTFCDLLWSDPDDSLSGWGSSPRGAGFLFGEDVVERFNHLNGIEYIARAHQLVMEGYKYMFLDKLVTIWSSPNYCYRCGNQAAILTIDGQSKQTKVFGPAITVLTEDVPIYFI
jgi:serine/threonine-protein phosphatase 4 catalytic subunit